MSRVIAAAYEIQEEIGAGGAGVVYLGEHLRLGKKIVLKADKRKLTTRPDILRQEVDALKNLSHSYIPHVYDFITEDDTVYTVMDYIEGESLDRPLNRGERFPQPQVIQWAKQLLDALCYLHSRPPYGILHSDIKPANLMLTPGGDIRLIDFNIALALGEEGAVRVGYSQGYASPEHYGQDYSKISAAETVKTAPTAAQTTVLLDENDQPIAQSSVSGTGKRTILLDVRSDIYSVGATLYHLLTGIKPAKDARQVVPIQPGMGVSQAVIDIIQTSMQPDPNDRYQTAQEMLTAFETLRKNDVRAKRLKRRTAAAAAVLAVMFLTGGGSSFAGLRQVQQAEATARIAAEAEEETQRQAKQALTDVRSSEQAYQAGDITEAVRFALNAISVDSPYSAQAQKALTDALGVYDLSQGFKPYLALTLPSEPLKAALSPDGERVAVLTSGCVTVFDTETGQETAQLPAENSALASMVFVDNDRLIYAGEGALRAVDLSSGEELWSGNAATGIAVSGDGSTTAAVCKDAGEAQIYDTATASLSQTVDFGGKHQDVMENDTFLDPENRLFALDEQGRWLAVSFSDGSLRVFCLDGRGEDVDVLDASAYTRFEGGFFGQYFAFSATGGEESIFAVVDLAQLSQLASASATTPLHAQADETGIYLASQNVLVQFDPLTGEQTELAYTGGFDITAFARGEQFILALTADGTGYFFNQKAELTQTYEDIQASLIQTAGQYAVLADPNTPQLRLLRLENHPEAELFLYDADYGHLEAKVSGDGSTAMLYRYDGFRIYHADGTLLADVELPDAAQVYDQQYHRESGDCCLDVIYNSGLVRRYSTADGSLLSETAGEPPDGSLTEEFLTEQWRIVAEPHGTPQVYDRNSGELVRTLEQDAYLTYVTQVDEYLITEYITTQGDRYGLLVNQDWDTLAYLPGLCDILPDGTLVFDDQMGTLRQSRIYSTQELIALGNAKLVNPVG